MYFFRSLIYVDIGMKNKRNHSNLKFSFLRYDESPSFQKTDLLFYEQPFNEQLAIGWQIVFRPRPAFTNQQLKESGVFPLQ